MSVEKFKIIEVPFRKPRHILSKLYYVLRTGSFAIAHPHEDRIATIIVEAESDGYALHRRREDRLNRKTILSFVPLATVLEDRLRLAEIPFRRKITPRTVLVWFYSILFMFLPWDMDDVEVVPDERKISDLVDQRAEQGYVLIRREDDHLNMKTRLKFDHRLGKE